MNSRSENWTKVSHQIGGCSEPYFVKVVQQIGKLDVKLIFSGNTFQSQESRESGFAELDEHMMFSYLWVLAAYEFVRAFSQRVREDSSLLPTQLGSELKEVKENFERVRIPLAKLEPAKRHQSTDSSIAWPVWNSRHGAAWAVTDEVIISRLELSEKLLNFLLKID